MHKSILLLSVALILSSCAGRTSREVLAGSRKKYAANAYWNAFAAAQAVLQGDGFVINLSQQSKGVMVATIQKTEKKNRTLTAIAEQTGYSFRNGDMLRVIVSLSMTPKNQSEMRVSVIRERENEWSQEDGDEIGNEAFYSDFFGKVSRSLSGKESAG